MGALLPRARNRANHEIQAGILKTPIVLVLISALIAAPLFADTVVMKSGKSYTGEIIVETAEYIRLKTDKQILKIKRSAIAEIAVPEVEGVEPEELKNARAYAEAVAKDKVAAQTWVAAGLLLGPIGVLFAYATTPSLPESYLVGKSPEYVEAFTDAYTEKGKSIQRSRALQGCVAGVVVGGCVYLMISTTLKIFEEF